MEWRSRKSQKYTDALREQSKNVQAGLDLIGLEHYNLTKGGDEALKVGEECFALTYQAVKTLF